MCNLIFDVKMEFSRNDQMIANGTMNKAPSSLTYSSVIYRDSVNLDFLIAGINDLDIMARDVGNAYLNAPCQENIWFTVGPDNGLEKTFKIMVMVRVLYGLNSSGSARRKIFAETLRDMDFVPTVADPDVYNR